APGNIVTGRQLDFLVDFLLHLGHQTSHVPVAYKDADGHHALAEFAADVHAAGLDRYLRELVQGDALAVRRIDQNGFDVVHLALLPRQAHDDGELLFPFPDFGRLFPAERGFDHVLDVRDFQAVSGGFRAVDVDLQLRDLAVSVDKRASDAANRGD